MAIRGAKEPTFSGTDARKNDIFLHFLQSKRHPNERRNPAKIRQLCLAPPYLYFFTKKKTEATISYYFYLDNFVAEKL